GDPRVLRGPGDGRSQLAHRRELARAPRGRSAGQRPADRGGRPRPDDRAVPGGRAEDGAARRREGLRHPAQPVRPDRGCRAPGEGRRGSGEGHPAHADDGRPRLRRDDHRDPVGHDVHPVRGRGVPLRAGVHVRRGHGDGPRRSCGRPRADGRGRAGRRQLSGKPTCGDILILMSQTPDRTGGPQQPAPPAAPVDQDFSFEAVPLTARRGFWRVGFVMLGFTFFSASMSVGASLGNGVDLTGFVWAVVIGGIILGAYTGALGYIGAKTGEGLDLLAQRAFGTRGSYLPSALISVTQMGWFGVGVAMFANPTGELLGVGPWPIVIVAGALMTASAYYGIRAIEI